MALEAVKEFVDKAIKTTQGIIKSKSSGAPEEIKEAEEFFKDCMSEQKAMQKVWFTNIAYLIGLHWLDWSDGQEWFVDRAKPSWRVRMVVNRMLPAVRTEAAKILKTNPILRAVPFTDTDEARDGAKVGDKFLESMYYGQQCQRKMFDLVMWFLTCGSAYLWTPFDPLAGKEFQVPNKDPKTGLPLLDDEGNPITKTLYVGDIAIDVSSPFETIMETSAPTDFNEVPRIMRCNIRSLEYIEWKYDIEAKAEDVEKQLLFKQRVAGLISPGAVGSTKQLRPKNSAVVKEYCKLPTKKNPEGQRFIYVGDQFCVEPLGLEYRFMSKPAIPVSKFDHIVIPGRPLAMSAIEQGRPLNDIENKMNSQVVENANLMAQPKILSPVGSLEIEAWTDEPSEIVEYTPIGGLKPEGFKPPELPAYFFQMKDQLPGMIQDVMGINDPSLGKLPRRATSGKAIGFLQDADDTRMGLTIRNMGTSLERSGSIMLHIAKTKFIETRLIEKMGDGHEFEVWKFKGLDLAGCEKCRVEIDVAMSRSTRINIAMEMADKELIPKDIVRQIIGNGDLSAVWNEHSEQIDYAKIENLQMAKGIMIGVGPMEHHPSHIKTHGSFMRSENFRKYPPAIQKIFQMHQQEHEMAEQQAQAPGASMPPGIGAPAPGAAAPPAGGQAPVGAPSV